jgi:XTP/dITP diphosphohydrolase
MNDMELLIATGNPGKVREYDELFAGLPITCISPAEIGIHLQVDESGTTYAENATIKAVAFARASGRVTLADDSGLDVDALDGRPGVHSARYGGPGLGDADRWRSLLKELVDVPWEERTARFRCVIAVASPEGEVTTVNGTCEGVIAFSAAGEGGFGYDPVFYLPDYGCTMAQLPAGVKNQISHRGRAAEAARPVLLKLAAQTADTQNAP